MRLECNGAFVWRIYITYSHDKVCYKPVWRGFFFFLLLLEGLSGGFSRRISLRVPEGVFVVVVFESV